MLNSRTDFLGYPVDNISKKEIIDICDRCISENTYNFFAVQNANKMYLSQKYPILKNSVAKAKIILPENAINMGMRWLNKPLKERNIGGIHIMEMLLEKANLDKSKIFLLGATQRNLEVLVTKIEEKYPNLIISGFNNGYFKKEDEQIIVNKINKAEPNYLFVGMGSPKQELFIVENLEQLKSNINLGVGGSFNVIAGLEKPAPRWTKFGMEWLYRSFQDPKKFKRYIIINTFFIKEFIKYLVSRK